MLLVAAALAAAIRQLGLGIRRPTPVPYRIPPSGR